jgi:phosphatidate cytidylyltransferase
MGFLAPRSRLLIGWSMFALLLASVWFGGVWWSLLILIACGVAIQELLGLLDKTNHVRPSYLVLIVFSAALMLEGVAGKPTWFMPTLTLAVITTFIGLLLRVVQKARQGVSRIGGSMADMGATLMVLFYLAFLPAHWLLLRQLGGNEMGRVYVLYAVLVVVGSDVGAYFTGKRFGRSLLIAEISPKKTREGALGGLLFSLCLGALLAPYCHMAYWQSILLAGILSIVAQLGDLVESLMKRDAGVKETGHILYGHGGVLDRIDSWLFVGPVAYYGIEWLVLQQGWLWQEAIPFFQKYF